MIKKLPLKNKYKNFKKKFILDFFTKTSKTGINKILRKKKGEKVNFTQKDVFILDISQPLAEIDSICSLLNFLPIIINSTNYNYVKKGISAVEQFKYHLEFYLNQLYILNQRLNKIINILIKKTKDSNQKKFLKDQIDMVNTSFNSILTVRGKYVHDRKYSDKTLYRMELIEKVLTIEKEVNKRILIAEGYEEEVKRCLKDNRIKWKKMMEDNSKKTEVLLDVLYYNLFNDKNGVFKKNI